jgi:hypothetical protein
MAFYTEKISTIRMRLRDWLKVTGGEVPSLDLDLINRAHQWLQSYRNWDCLKKTTILSVGDNTVNGVIYSKSSKLPTDLSTIFSVYVDNATVGKPNIYFYENDSDIAQRYMKEYIFDSSDATQSYWIITWPSVSPLLSNPKCEYLRILPDFIGGNSDEYTFFPGELLLRTAQMLRIEEKGLTGDNNKALLDGQLKNLANFERMNQFNNVRPDMVPKNKYGMPIHISGYRMDGNKRRAGSSPYTPAQAAGFHGF